MATILLDSSVIFDHLNGRAGRTEFLEEMVGQGHFLSLFASSICWAEETGCDGLGSGSTTANSGRGRGEGGHSSAPGFHALMNDAPA